MNKKFYIPILVIIISAIAIFLIPENSSMPSSENLYQYGFTFYDVEKIKDYLYLNKIFLCLLLVQLQIILLEITVQFVIIFYLLLRYCTTTAIQGQMEDLLEISVWVEFLIIL